MRIGHKARAALIGTCAVLVALIAIAFAVGGSGSDSGGASQGLNRTTAAAADTPTDSVGVPGEIATLGPVRQGPGKNGPLPSVAGAPALASAPEYAASGVASSPTGGSVGRRSSAADGEKLAGTGSSLEASKIIKTGNLTIRVPKLAVKETTQKLAALATAQGGYVSASNASLDTSSPYGEVVLRVPVAHFQDTIDAASRLGQKVVSLVTSADDVTGKFVDLAAKKHALERTRSTYLTILSRARTIGATLAVQQRIDDVQQQIDQLHGQLKLIGNQASYSTLTVDVVPSGVETFAATHHQRHGLGKAWHDSWSRFGRGVNAIVGAIGPIVFALLLIAVLGLIGYGGYRGFRRATRGSQATA
jgi:hypothetical protein